MIRQMSGRMWRGLGMVLAALAGSISVLARTLVKPLIIWRIRLYAIAIICYVINIISRDKELGSCSDGWGKCVEVRGPPIRRKWDNARSVHRSFPAPALQAAALLRPQDPRAPGRVETLPPFIWGDSWCAIRENSDSSLFRPRLQYLRRWSNARSSLWGTGPNASALATTH